MWRFSGLEQRHLFFSVLQTRKGNMAMHLVICCFGAHFIYLSVQIIFWIDRTHTNFSLGFICHLHKEELNRKSSNPVGVKQLCCMLDLLSAIIQATGWSYFSLSCLNVA
ncbi:hypothetical protein GOODEAATRI_027488 [Goodea atripinnis]|uniref:Vomeronasal type-1 receptor n=1 Tax=Goodea atripinnis TaxID=208336 RepID=A0ABV0P889_9TELE